MVKVVEIIEIFVENVKNGFDEIPLPKGPTTRAMAKRTQEEWASNEHARPKMEFTWAKEDVKT